MEVKIGVINANRELTLDTNQSVDDVRKAITDALSSERGLVSFADDKGRTVVVPVEKLAYVEISGESGRRVGFGSA
ncbi:MAG TPA: DUF3107 domain-containing protein [Nocardioidaceae bacterium]